MRSTTRKSRLVTFSLRTLFLAATVLAGLMGAAIYSVEANQRSMRALENCGARLRGGYGNVGGPWLVRTLFKDRRIYELEQIWFTRDASVDDADVLRLVPHLATFKYLSFVCLYYQPKLTGRCLGVLAESRAGARINEIQLKMTGINDDGVAHLSSFPHLSSVEIHNATITDRCIPDLVAIPSLERIEVVNTAISQTGLEQLKALLPACRVNYNVDKLSKLAAISIIEKGSRVRQDEDGFTIVELRAEKVPITNAILTAATQCGQLRELTAHNSQITDGGLMVLFGLPHLRALHLNDSGNITDAAIAHFAEMTTLDELTLTGTGMSAEGVGQLRDLLPHCEIGY